MGHGYSSGYKMDMGDSGEMGGMDMGSTMPPMKMDMDMDMHMWMWFHAAINDTVLFDFWKIKTVGAMIYSCVIVFSLGILVELIKFLRYRVDAKMAHTDYDITAIRTNYFARLFSARHVVQTLLFCLQMAFAYVLMLIFMTFSIWLCIAVVLGSAVGFYFFGARGGSAIH